MGSRAPDVPGVIMRQRHSFAPLGRVAEKGQLSLQGVVFDMDGTLCEPQNYMFAQMRAAIGIDKSIDILNHIHALSDERERDLANARIQAIEREAMMKQVAQPGLVPLMEFLDRHGVKRGICTRNFDLPVTHFTTTHVPASLQPFSPIITRAFTPPKPSPAGILHIAQTWGIVTEEGGGSTTVSGRDDNGLASSNQVAPALLPLIMVGDSVDDMAAGRDAGALTVLLRSKGKEYLEGDRRTDVVISRLDELIGLIEMGIQAR